MFTIEHFRRLHDYETWANTEVIGSLRSAEAAAQSPEAKAAFARARGIFAHVQMARHEWLARLGGVERRPWLMFPDWPVEQCRADAARLDAAWAAYLRRPEAEALDQPITYSSTEGKPFSGVRGEILTHVYNHSTYHRGQLAMLVKQAGGAPASTDFIVYTRRPTAPAR